MTKFKHLFFYLLATVITVSLFSSCSDDDDTASLITTKVIVKYPEGYTGEAASLVVKAKNATTGKEYSAPTDLAGLAELRVEVGVYNFTVTTETEEYALNASKENVQVAVNETSVSLELVATALKGGLVIKEIYYVGSKTSAGKTYMADQFFEIYNNSDEIIYLDNLGFGTLDPTTSNTPSAWVDDKDQMLDRFPLFGFSFYIKGTGKDHPLQPRTSVVIAIDGINHKSDPSGNPDSPVDLSNATWETYVGDINNGKDADAAGVPNVEILATTSTAHNDFLPSINGPALILFQFPADVDPVQFASSSANLMTKPGSSGSAAKVEYVMIPKEYVVDAVECVNSVENKRFKRLPNDLDAGSIFIEGTYNGKSVRRKAKDIIGGKVIYKDTNNTTEDFEVLDTPTPFVNPTSVK